MMAKGILLIACFLVLSGCSVADDKDKVKDDPEMEILVDNISELASKVLEIFDPIAAKATNDSSGDRDNTYFVSFLLRDRKNRSMSDADSNLKRMVVNNNFSGEKMGTSQLFVENGQPAKQSPSHNVQLLNNNGIAGPPQAQGFPPSSYPPKPFPQQQQQPMQPPMQPMTYG